MTRLLNDWISSYLEFTENSEPPILFKKWTAISLIASALERKCRLRWGSLTFYPNMYIILVAPSGKARKGTAMNPARDILDEIPNIHLAAESITREALIQEMKAAGANPCINPVTGAQSWHASLTVHSQELTVFLGFNNYSLMSDLTDWYDCRNKWTYRTKHQGTDKIEGVWLNLIGATTPELIQSSMPVDAIGLGLTSRFIFVYEHKKSRCIPDPFQTKEELHLRDQLIMDLEKINMMQGDFNVTEDFIDLWTHWYPAQEDNPPFDDNRFNGYFERRPNHVMKLSSLLNASRTSNMLITVEDLQNAIDLLGATEVNMPNTFSGFGKNALADTLSKAMAYIGNRGEVDYSELMNHFHRDVSRFELDRILDTLQGMDFCEIVTNTGIIKYKKEYSGSMAPLFIK
jgi:hypothetical protein